jgi:hypothetical protein
LQKQRQDGAHSLKPYALQGKKPSYLWVNKERLRKINFIPDIYGVMHNVGVHEIDTLNNYT